MRWGFQVSLCLLGLIAAASAQSPSTQEFQQTYPLPAGKNVHIRTITGNVHVVGWDRADVKVDAIKRAKDTANLASAQVSVVTQSQELCIATQYPAARKPPKAWFGFGIDLCRDPQNFNSVNIADLARIDYTVSVPRNAAIVVIVEDGDVDVEGTTQYVFVDIQKGHLTARDVSGDCKLYGSYSGVNVTLNSLPRNTHIDSAVGPLVVNLSPAISARIRAHGARGIENDFGWIERSRQMEGTMGDGKVALDVNSGGGRVEIRKLTAPAPPAAGNSKVRRPAVRPK